MRRVQVGPGSSTDHKHVATNDPGKEAAAGSGGDFRRFSTATGPQSSKTEYVSTLDPGKNLASTAAGSPDDFFTHQAKEEGQPDPQ